uniref:Fe_hyd_lg_C domain-containing protein n=1 Tax=Glossina austeni TaxID=7395 RepID=A0A1A9VS66_GLOAU
MLHPNTKAVVATMKKFVENQGDGLYVATFLVGKARLEGFLEESPPIESNFVKARSHLQEAKRCISLVTRENEKKAGIALDAYLLSMETRSPSGRGRRNRKKILTGLFLAIHYTVELSDDETPSVSPMIYKARIVDFSCLRERSIIPLPMCTWHLLSKIFMLCIATLVGHETFDMKYVGLTIMSRRIEGRFHSKSKEQSLPLLNSCCPGWVCYAENKAFAVPAPLTTRGG